MESIEYNSKDELVAELKSASRLELKWLTAILGGLLAIGFSMMTWIAKSFDGRLTSQEITSIANRTDIKAAEVRIDTQKEGLISITRELDSTKQSQLIILGQIADLRASTAATRVSVENTEKEVQNISMYLRSNSHLTPPP